MSGFAEMDFPSPFVCVAEVAIVGGMFMWSCDGLHGDEGRGAQWDCMDHEPFLTGKNW